LLTKLHVPAGKAVALAAMPTAVLMGMGMTPHLAQADEPSSPFAPGPCVTQSDSPSPSASPGASATSSPTSTSKDAKDSKDGAKDSGATSKATDKAGSGTKSGGSTAKPSPSASASGGSSSAKPSGSPSPSPSASPTKSVNPLDPLGLGDLLGGLLGGKSQSAAPTPTATTASPQPTATTTAPKADTRTSDGTKAGASPSATTADPVRHTVKKAEKAVKGLADPTATGTPSPSASASSGAAEGAGGTKDGKQAYPCPVYDAKALSDADVEQGIPLVPDQPWTLKSSVLTLHGLNYDGIVKVKTASGTVKDVLKFTATGVDIGDLDQTVVGPRNTHTEVKAAKGSTSTIRNGTVTMYTESLSGNLLGLIPITFTPKAPPPLTLPELFFTDVTVVQAAQFGGDLHVPGMQVLPGQP
jgi:hypothetical protein